MKMKLVVTVSSSLAFATAMLPIVGAAAVTSAPSGTITACVSKFDGFARIVAAPSACVREFETVTQWQAQGVAGPQGVQGPQGPAGPMGLTGAQGSQGLAGTRGPTGPVGPVGPAGPVGLAGPAGIAGLQGPVGPAGPAGAAGANGAAGPVGTPGLAGLPGAAGPTGPAGPAGTAGATGVTGPAGVAGPSGPTGPAGAAGGSSSFVYSSSNYLGYLNNQSATPMLEEFFLISGVYRLGEDGYDSAQDGAGSIPPANSFIKVPSACTASNLRVVVDGISNTVAPNQSVPNLRLSLFSIPAAQTNSPYLTGTDTTLPPGYNPAVSCTIPVTTSTTASCSDTTHTLSLAAGDYIAVAAVLDPNVTNAGATDIFLTMTCN